MRIFYIQAVLAFPALASQYLNSKKPVYARKLAGWVVDIKLIVVATMEVSEDRPRNLNIFEALSLMRLRTTYDPSCVLVSFSPARLKPVSCNAGHFCRALRISVNNWMSAGGASGSAGASSSSARILLTYLTIMKMMKAMMMKFTSTVRKLP